MHVSLVQYNDVSAYSQSDIRLKQNLETIESILADVILARDGEWKPLGELSTRLPQYYIGSTSPCVREYR